MKKSLVNFHELAMNELGLINFKIIIIKVMNFNEKPYTEQAHNNSSQFMKQSLMNFFELALNRTKTYQVHNNSSKFTKLSHELSLTSYELN